MGYRCTLNLTKKSKVGLTLIDPMYPNNGIGMRQEASPTRHLPVSSTRTGLVTDTNASNIWMKGVATKGPIFK